MCQSVNRPRQRHELISCDGLCAALAFAQLLELLPLLPSFARDFPVTCLHLLATVHANLDDVQTQ